MQTIFFLGVIGWVLVHYGDRLQAALEFVWKQGEAGAEYAQALWYKEWPRLRNWLIAMFAYTALLFAASLHLILWGVKLNEARLAVEKGADFKMVWDKGLGLMDQFGEVPSFYGGVAVGIFLVLQLLWTVKRFMMPRVPARMQPPPPAPPVLVPYPEKRLGESDLAHLVRWMWYRVSPVVYAIMAIIALNSARNFATFMEELAFEEASYLRASMAVAAGALIFGVWLFVLSRLLLVLAWAAGTAADLAGNFAWKALDFVVDILAAGGLAERLEKRAQVRARFTAVVEGFSWPTIIIWLVVCAALIVFPEKNAVIALFPLGAFLLALSAIRIFNGWREMLTKVAFGLILVFGLPGWGISVLWPTARKAAHAWVVEGNVVAHCWYPDENPECTAWKMKRVAAKLGDLGGLPDLPDLPGAPTSAPEAPARQDDRTVDAPPDDE